jgi:hypothetical protein
MKNIGLRNGNIFCFNCGDLHVIQEYTPIHNMVEIVTGFEERHKDCEKTWQEPEINPDLDLRQKIEWWWNNGERGLSSECMWNCLSGKKNFKVYVPHDPDDFQRAYKLLGAIPEWRTELYKLRELSPQWNKLIANWNKLTRMYEEHIKKDEYKMVDLYDLIQECIR